MENKDGKILDYEYIMGYRTVTSDLFQILDFVFDWIQKGCFCKYLACINPHSYVASMRDPVFTRALYDADFVIPDGTGIIIASQVLGGKITHRVTGSDIFNGLNKKLNLISGKVFLLGSTEDSLERIANKMQIEWPYIRIVGCYSPPFKTSFSNEDNRAMVAAVNATTPDVVWVGMTAPKQEKWIFENRSDLNVKFAGAVGAVFDFYTGRIKRSHPFFQRLGLEWLPRLIREPTRLWNRNFYSTPKFLYRLAIEWKRRRELLMKS